MNTKKETSRVVYVVLVLAILYLTMSFLTLKVYFDKANRKVTQPQNNPTQKVNHIKKPIITSLPPIPTPQQTKEVEQIIKLYSQEEVDAITRTLSGESYDDKLEDKRKVAETIVNRVSEGSFGKTVLEVASAKGQFHGYWKPSRPVSESDISIAKEVLTEWYLNDCKALSEYLYFSSGPNRENVFRSTFLKGD